MIHFDLIFGIVLVGTVLLAKAASESLLGRDALHRGMDLVPAAAGFCLSCAAIGIYLWRRGSWVDLLFIAAAMLAGTLMAVSTRKRLSG